MIKKTTVEAFNRYVFKVVKESVSGGDEICRLEKFDATEAPTRKLWIPRCIKLALRAGQKHKSGLKPSVRTLCFFGKWNFLPVLTVSSQQDDFTALTTLVTRTSTSIKRRIPLIRTLPRNAPQALFQITICS